MNSAVFNRTLGAALELMDAEQLADLLAHVKSDLAATTELTHRPKPPPVVNPKI